MIPIFSSKTWNEFGEITAIPNNEEKYVSFSLKIIWGEFEDNEGKNIIYIMKSVS